MRILAKWSAECMAICLVILWLQAPGGIQAGDSFGSAAENLSLTEYDDVQPILKIHAARMFVGHEKYGFFRFGLAPLAVIQGARIQLDSACRLTNALVNLNSWKPVAGGLRHLEIRELEISLFGEQAPRLRAATARPSGAGALELSQVALAGEPGVAIPKATLEMCGPTAGRLHWRDGAREAGCFFLQSSETPQLKP